MPNFNQQRVRPPTQGSWPQTSSQAMNPQLRGRFAQPAIGMGGSMRMPQPPQQFGPQQSFGRAMPAGLRSPMAGGSISNMQSMPDAGGVVAGRQPQMNAVQAARMQGQGMRPGFDPNDPRNAALAAYGQR